MGNILQTSATKFMKTFTQFNNIVKIFFLVYILIIFEPL